MKGINFTNKGGKLPQRQTKHSIGYDCFVKEAVISPCGKKVKYFLGFGTSLPANVGAFIFPRSSVSMKDLRLSNCVGVGDPDFKGEYTAVFDVIGDAPIYQEGERCCQVLFIPILFEENDDFINKERKGGTGSTGNS